MSSDSFSAGATQFINSGFHPSIDKPGGLHDVTDQMRNDVFHIDNAPAQFHIDASFDAGGNAAANIYRSCFARQTVLLLLVKTPAKITDWRGSAVGELQQVCG